MLHKQMLCWAVIAAALTACGQSQDVVEAPTAEFTQQQLDATYDQIVTQRPEVQSALRKLGLNSIQDMKKDVLYTILPTGEVQETSVVDLPKLGAQQLGVGVPRIAEEVNGIVAGRLDAWSRASISCVDASPFDGIDARATVTHSISVVGPNNRTFGPYTSTTGTGYGFAQTARKFMGGNTTATGRYAFAYFLEASCDGAQTFGRGESIWSVAANRASVVQPLVLQPY
ncbi:MULTISPECIES: hypothetical protein [Deinococcus]|uniref:Uncharacterized protein n=3 Tax=Deinococcus TaxID=1298 RepID=A0ABY7V8F8_9DEIO|nr:MULTISPECIES: hypothetical protein [Deinococcus]WDA60517.1 hypothetical protein M8445_17415 [Deinococcus aquaticus]